jgi:hypothetical protein
LEQRHPEAVPSTHGRKTELATLQDDVEPVGLKVLDAIILKGKGIKLDQTLLGVRDVAVPLQEVERVGSTLHNLFVLCFALWGYYVFSWHWNLPGLENLY